MVKLVILIALLFIALSSSAPTQENGRIEKREASPHHHKKIAVIKVYEDGYKIRGHKGRYQFHDGGPVLLGGPALGGGQSFSQAQSSSFSKSFNTPYGSFSTSGSQSSSGAGSQGKK